MEYILKENQDLQFKGHIGVKVIEGKIHYLGYQLSLNVVYRISSDPVLCGSYMTLKSGNIIISRSSPTDYESIKLKMETKKRKLSNPKTRLKIFALRPQFEQV